MDARQNASLVITVAAMGQDSTVMRNAVVNPVSEDTERTLHHFGFVVKSIEETAEDMAQSTGATWDGSLIYDPCQLVRVAFLRYPNSHEPMMELVEPARSESFVLNFLKRGGGLHHLCYEVCDLERQLERSRSSGALIVRTPVPAIAFGGRRIAWVYTRKRLLLEYLER